MTSNESKTGFTVLIFDSGIGGLSVYKEIRQLMPNLHYIYAFDNAGFPYGDKSEAVIVERCSQFISKLVAQHHVDIAVIACNTASTICLPALRAKFSFPIVGVVPAVKPAAKISQNKHIGLLATKATVKRSYTQNLIAQFAPDCQIERLGLSELALIAEEKLHGAEVDMAQLTQLLQPWLTLTPPLDTIILGCTHYPFIEKELRTLFPNVAFVDSGYAIACRVAFLLQDVLDKKQINAKIGPNKVFSTKFDNKVKELIPVLAHYQLTDYTTIELDIG